MTEAEENKMVEDAFQRLLDTYLDSPHRKKVDIITTAFNFARQAHKGVRRLSGEPYIMHPLAVAQIASQEMGLGSTSICSALLHDVVEDTEYTTEDLQNIFGPKIAEIVDGLTKISGGIFGDHASPQTENLKKLLLAKPSTSTPLWPTASDSTKSRASSRTSASNTSIPRPTTASSDSSSSPRKTATPSFRKSPTPYASCSTVSTSPTSSRPA